MTAQDRRIESLVKNVDKMNASQVEMELDLEHLKIMKTSENDILLTIFKYVLYLLIYIPKCFNKLKLF